MVGEERRQRRRATRRALAGFSTGGLPLGYRSIPQHDEHGRLVGHRVQVDEEAAGTIRRIFDDYLKGDSYAAIAHTLNQEFVPPPRAKTRHRRKGWVASTIRGMLLNEAYVGVALQEKFSRPEALEYLRKRIAEFLGETNRNASAELGERRQRLARTEQRIAALIRFIADGDSSEYVVTALRDLQAQARTEKAAIASLEARGATPIALPTPAEVADRALNLKRLFDGKPLEVREALRRYFVDGRIVLTPVAEGHYVAEGRFLPLVALVDPALDSAPERGRRASWYFVGCAGRI